MARKIDLALPDNTITFAKIVANLVKLGDVIALEGKLGAGKTFFSQAFALELGVTEPVSSPSYVLLNEYDATDYKISHFDLFRLNDQDEVFEIGIPDIFEDGITLIEWPEILDNMLPDDTIFIFLEYNGTGREATISSQKPGFMEKLNSQLIQNKL